jgi:hypothetical protein
LQSQIQKQKCAVFKSEEKKKNFLRPNRKQKIFREKSETESAVSKSETKICCVHIRNKNLSRPVQTQKLAVTNGKTKTGGVRIHTARWNNLG